MGDSRNKVVKLVNTSSRKKFKSVSEAKEFIDNNTIAVDVNGSCDEIIIEEVTTIVKYTKVKSVDKFSDDSKLAVFDILKGALKTHKIHSNDLIFSLVREKLEQSNFLLLEILKSDFNDNEAKKIIDKIINWKGSFMDEDIFYNGETYYDFIRNLKFDETNVLLKYLNHIQKTKPSELEFVATKTNYKPCNSYGVRVGRICVTLREGDIMFSNSTTMGRNVSVTGIYKMVNEDITKMNKFLK